MKGGLVMSGGSVLDYLRERAEKSVNKRRNGKIRAVLGYSMCSISVGANEVLKAMQQVVSDGGFENIIIETTGCPGLCSKEPLLNIYMPDGRGFTYELVTPEKARAIIVSHSVNGECINDWLLKNEGNDDYGQK